MYSFNSHSTPRREWHFLLHFSEGDTKKWRGDLACWKSCNLHVSEPGPEPSGFGFVPSPATGLCSLEHEGEGEPAPAPYSLRNVRKRLNSHQRAKRNIIQRQMTWCGTWTETPT